MKKNIMLTTSELTEEGRQPTRCAIQRGIHRVQVYRKRCYEAPSPTLTTQIDDFAPNTSKLGNVTYLLYPADGQPNKGTVIRGTLTPQRYADLIDSVQKANTNMISKAILNR